MYDCLGQKPNMFAHKLKFTLLPQLIATLNNYCIAGKFGGEKVWQIDSFRAFGERKFGELIDQPISYQL